MKSFLSLAREDEFLLFDAVFAAFVTVVDVVLVVYYFGLVTVW